MSINKIKQILKRYGVSENDIELEVNKLSKKFGKTASENDAIWSIFNQLLIKNINNLYKTKTLYFEMGLFLDFEGKNPNQMLEQSHRIELLELKEKGHIKRVKVLTAGKASCKDCQKLVGKIFDINDALEKMPLPVKNCSHYNYNKKFGWCRCLWIPVIE
jgi:hypothetical protein